MSRSGSYIKQPQGHSSFLPVPLPPNPPVHFDAELLDLFARAERALGRLDGSTATLPNADLFVFMYVRKEAVLSSQIEGTQSSLTDLLEAESAIHRPDQPDDVEEVSSYVGALNYGLGELATRSVSTELILELHARLMAGQRGGDKEPGRLRSVQNWIGRSGSTLENAVFVPPPPDKVAGLLGDLETFLQGNEPPPPLVKIALAHAHFETIHPFRDGNGRVGRLLVSLLMREYGILRHPLLFLSSYFKENRTEYYARLQDTREKGNWEAWLRFFLRGVAETASDAATTASQILVMREQHREALQRIAGKGAGTALDLLETLYFRPYITVQGATEIVGQTFAGANRLVGKFVEAKILVPTDERARNRVFAYRPFLDLF